MVRLRDASINVMKSSNEIIETHPCTTLIVGYYSTSLDLNCKVKGFDLDNWRQITNVCTWILGKNWNIQTIHMFIPPCEWDGTIWYQHVSPRHLFMWGFYRALGKNASVLLTHTYKFKHLLAQRQRTQIQHLYTHQASQYPHPPTHASMSNFVVVCWLGIFLSSSPMKAHCSSTIPMPSNQWVEFFLFRSDIPGMLHKSVSTKRHDLFGATSSHQAMISKCRSKGDNNISFNMGPLVPSKASSAFNEETG